ncbi:hypothetical protein SDC9_128932 [bioreactor metagenome]|uniref:Uncharacterized protein n=1 Tax=bioreactor metagenome TaxID=1076179 RepID=A0A645CYC6_9ZZZZ
MVLKVFHKKCGGCASGINGDLPVFWQVSATGVMVKDLDRGLFGKALECGQRLGIHQGDLLQVAVFQITIFHERQFRTIQVDEAFDVTVHACRQDHLGGFIQQPGAVSRSEGVKVSLFVGKDHFHALILA